MTICHNSQFTINNNKIRKKGENKNERANKIGHYTCNLLCCSKSSFLFRTLIFLKQIPVKKKHTHIKHVKIIAINYNSNKSSACDCQTNLFFYLYIYIYVRVFLFFVETRFSSFFLIRNFFVPSFGLEIPNFFLMFCWKFTI